MSLSASNAPQPPFLLCMPTIHSRARDRLAKLRPALLSLHAVHRHGDHGGVVDIGVMRIVVLERPAARAHAGPCRCPIADEGENLPGLEPGEPPARPGPCTPAAHIEQGGAGGARVPERRKP